ncbi:hypothetical protein L7815_010925 [Serratia marcescens]|uniref:hypothetical protein n=1 Tax=Serratia marcescens TaxID=615 RepID=UPI001EE76516|nr:hypothetical protein [Serratia marcescens]MCG5374447.1 hypothetical protein [Serratia marcescens]
MAKVTLVWNKEKNECVGFLEREENFSHADCGSLGDAYHAAGGEPSNPVSSLADFFRETYGANGGCSLQYIEIDNSNTESVEVVDFDNYCG